MEGSTAVTGQRLHSVGLAECLRRAAAAIGWGQPRPAPTGKGRYRGRGIAALHKSPTTVLSASSALVKLNEDGTFVVLTGASDIGQGSDTVLCQIAAEELGVSLEEVSILSADTEVTPFDHGTFSSRVTLYAGNAVRHAAADARRQLLEVASQMLEAEASALEIGEGRVWLRGQPQVSLPLATVAAATVAARGDPILGRGYAHGPGTIQGAGPVPGWKYGAQAAEVEVDTETGRVTVLKLAAAHDFGRAINPTNVEGQIEGGVVMGLGCTLAEEVVIDQGRVTNPTFMDYLVPTAVEAPPVQAIIVEEPLPEGPFGAKGGGEPSIIAVAPAIANAIYDAVGVRLTELPLTPERLLRAIQAKAPAARGP